jgi:hypothetical protein
MINVVLSQYPIITDFKPCLIMKKILFPLSFALGLAISLTSCDEVLPATTKSDVIRFDYEVSSDTVPSADSLFAIRFNNDTIRPYETEELSKYKSRRDDIEEYTIDKIDFRFFTITQDNPDNLMTGKVVIEAESGEKFELVLSETGDDYKTDDRHEITSITNGEVEGKEAYKLMAKELVDGDYFVVKSSELKVSHPLSASVSIYVDYTITAKAI